MTNEKMFTLFKRHNVDFANALNEITDIIQKQLEDLKNRVHQLQQANPPDLMFQVDGMKKSLDAEVRNFSLRLARLEKQNLDALALRLDERTKRFDDAIHELERRIEHLERRPHENG